MKFGICTSIERGAVARAAGWDYLEPPAFQLREGSRISLLPVRACNVLVPSTEKITGADVDLRRLIDYLADIFDGAAEMEVSTIVLGSGGARRVGEFDRAAARRQIIDFARAIAEMAARKQMTIALEPLNRQECDIINTLAEA